jgi:mitogen-activated protein kinase kinase
MQDQDHHSTLENTGNGPTRESDNQHTTTDPSLVAHFVGITHGYSLVTLPAQGCLINADTVKLFNTLDQDIQPSMSSPAPVPLLRPPIPGGRQNSGMKTPRLGLAIPPSPNTQPAKPAGLSLQMPGQMASRPSLPRLQLATPMGSNQTPPLYDQGHLQNGRPSTQSNANQSASGGSESSAAHSRTGSFGPLDGRVSGPTSAGSQYSALSFASQYGLRQPQGTPDPASAVGSLYSERSEGGVSMEREGSMNGLEAFDKLSLERARTLDVEELDDDGWRIASMEKRIEELGSLGEGAGGAVTRCMLKGGKTVFALKVGSIETIFSTPTDPCR